MKIAIGSDHRGFDAKERLAALLRGFDHEIVDLGTASRESCDYPDFALAVAEAVAKADAHYGILLCGSGVGVSITANKVAGVRAALCHDELTAEMSRRHNDANVLCLPADLIGDALMKRLVEVWLETKFEGGRHSRRVDKIIAYEKEHGCDGN